MTELEMRIEVFKELGWTDLAVRPPAPHHWPYHPLDKEGNALTGKLPGFNGFREPGPLDLNIMAVLFEHYRDIKNCGQVKQTGAE